MGGGASTTNRRGVLGADCSPRQGLGGPRLCARLRGGSRHTGLLPSGSLNSVGVEPRFQGSGRAYCRWRGGPRLEGGFQNILPHLETHAHPGSGGWQDPSEDLQSFPPAVSSPPQAAGSHGGRGFLSRVDRTPR